MLLAECPQKAKDCKDPVLLPADINWIVEIATGYNMDTSLASNCCGQVHTLLRSVIHALAAELRGPGLENIDIHDWRTCVCDVLQAYYICALEGTPFLPEREPGTSALADERSLVHLGHDDAEDGDEDDEDRLHVCKTAFAVGPFQLSRVVMHAFGIGMKLTAANTGAAQGKLKAQGKIDKPREHYGEAVLEAALLTGFRHLAVQLLKKPDAQATNGALYFAALPSLRPSQAIRMIVRLWYVHVPQDASDVQGVAAPLSPKDAAPPSVHDIVPGASTSHPEAPKPLIAPWLEYREAEAPAKAIVLRVMKAFNTQCSYEGKPFLLRADREWELIVDLLILRSAACQPFTRAMIDWVETSVAKLKEKLLKKQQEKAAEREASYKVTQIGGEEEDKVFEPDNDSLNEHSMKKFRQKTGEWRQFAVQAAKLAVFTQSNTVRAVPGFVCVPVHTYVLKTAACFLEG